MSAEEIGQILKKSRLACGKSVKEISQILTEKGFKAGEKTIYSWENGNSQPSPDALLTLCKLYNIRNVLGAFGYTDSNCTDSEQENLILSQDDKLTLNLFHQLDDNDKAEIRGEMKHMLKAEKYSVQEELKNA